MLVSSTEAQQSFCAGHAGAVYKYDLSLPPEDMYKLVEETRERMKELPVTVVGYGHMGDSNLHLNISAGAYYSFSCCLVDYALHGSFAKSDYGGHVGGV